MASSSLFPPLPISKITLPSTPLIASALTYTKEHTAPAVVNHCLRASAFALLIASKIPPLQGIDAETVVLSTLMHDLGWATTKGLLSKDTRFEVDGANLATKFLSAQTSASASDSTADPAAETRLTTVWAAIAMHTTFSIAIHHPIPEIAAVSHGVSADFGGPNYPGGLISVDEYKEIVGAFPRLGFNVQGLKEIMCTLCREKPETTYDNFVGQFGLRFEGEGYREEYEKHGVVGMLLGGLEACAKYE